MELHLSVSGGTGRNWTDFPLVGEVIPMGQLDWCQRKGQCALVGDLGFQETSRVILGGIIPATCGST